MNFPGIPAGFLHTLLDLINLQKNIRSPLNFFGDRFREIQNNSYVLRSIKNNVLNIWGRTQKDKIYL